jgi:hypothetical protein
MTFVPQKDPLTGKPYGISIGKNERIISTTDSIVDSIIDKFIERATIGKQKYNTDLDRSDLSLEDWLEHSIQEKLDDILYMQKALTVLRKSKTL